MHNKGLLIAAIGLPGSGKSSVTRELGKLMGIRTFHEPEEADWADAVTQRDICGRFTAMTWFRATRLPPLFEAHRLREQGATVMVDTYYDKLFGLCMDKEGMQWLINPSDDYFDVMKQVAMLDYEKLPDADVLVSFELDYDTWLQFLAARNRHFDKGDAFLKSFRTQQYFVDAALQYTRQTSCKLLRFKQEFSSPEESAGKLKEAILQLSAS